MSLYVLILILIVGMALIVVGADFIVDGASAVARKLGVSEFVIGLTIVGMGTSAPEMVVSFIGAIQGNADISVGNILGSNIFNTLLILGLTAILLPVAITRENLRRDIPIGLAITLLLPLVGMSRSLGIGGNDSLSRIDGIIFLVIFAAYMIISFKTGVSIQQEGSGETKPMKTGKAVFFIVGGLAALIFGGRILVNSATQIARMAGISDKVIAITILAGGTSLPELATCVTAAAKKKGQLALGNIIGSNIFNILLILGGSAVINELSFADIDFVDMGVLVLSALVLWLFAGVGKKNTLSRFEGVLMTLMWLGYVVYLFVKI